MQIGVLIKNEAGDIVEKRVYGGDLEAVEPFLENEGKDYEIFDDDSDPDFVGAEVVQTSVVDPNISPAIAAAKEILRDEDKTTEQKLAALITVLGL